MSHQEAPSEAILAYPPERPLFWSLFPPVACRRPVADTCPSLYRVKGNEPARPPGRPLVGGLRRSRSAIRRRASGEGNQKQLRAHHQEWKGKPRLPSPAPTAHRSRGDDGRLRRGWKATGCHFAENGAKGRKDRQETASGLPPGPPNHSRCRKWLPSSSRSQAAFR